MHVCLGFETAAVPNWKSLVLDPKPPSNYKNPDVIEKYVQEARLKLAAEAPDRLFTGHVSHAVAVDSRGEVVVGGNAPAFYAAMSAKCREIVDSGGTVTLFGIDVRRRLRQVWTEASEREECTFGPLAPVFWLSDALRGRLGLLGSAVAIVDVAEAVGCAKEQLVEYMVATVPYKLTLGAIGEASLVRTIVSRFQLDVADLC